MYPPTNYVIVLCLILFYEIYFYIRPFPCCFICSIKIFSSFTLHSPSAFKPEIKMEMKLGSELVASAVSVARPKRSFNPGSFNLPSPKSLSISAVTLVGAVRSGPTGNGGVGVAACLAIMRHFNVKVKVDFSHEQSQRALALAVGLPSFWLRFVFNSASVRFFHHSVGVGFARRGGVAGSLPLESTSRPFHSNSNSLALPLPMLMLLPWMP